jgi:Zinc finger, ZZ type
MVIRLLLDKEAKFVWTEAEITKVCHETVIRDGCNITPIRGLRYKCSDYDLCEGCFQKKKEIHEEHSSFLELPVKEPSRGNAKSVAIARHTV